MTRKNSRIGDWLVQEGLLDPDTVEVIERERQRTRLRFLSQAIRERFIDQKTALDALSRFTGYPTIDLDIVTVPDLSSTRYRTILRHRSRVSQLLSATGLSL